MKKLIIFLLISCFQTAVIAEPVDLNSYPAYAYSDFKEEWIDNPFLEIEKFLKIPPDKNGKMIGRAIFKDKDKNGLLVMTIIIIFHLDRPPEDIFSSPGLFLSGIGENWEIFLNGNLVSKEIYVTDRAITKFRALRNHLIPIKQSHLQAGDNVLMFHLLGESRSEMTGLFVNGPYLIDDYEKLFKGRIQYIPIFLIALFLWMGTYHIYLYFRIFRFHSNLIYGIFLYLYSFLLFLTSNHADGIIANTKNIQILINITLFASASIFAWIFDLLLLGYFSIMGRAYMAISAIFVIITLSSSIDKTIIMHVYSAFEVLFSFWIFYHSGKNFLNEYNGISQENPDKKTLRLFFRALIDSLGGMLFISTFILVLAIVTEILIEQVYNKNTNLIFLASTFFLITMTLRITKRFEEAVNSEETMQIRILEQEKRMAIERDLALAHEREKVFVDFHDHFGHLLNNLKKKIREIALLKAYSRKKVSELESISDLLIKNFRSRLLSLEDMDVLRKDFINGLRLLIFRRYEAANRDTYFFCNEKDAETINQKILLNSKETIYKVAREIINNDLKYGYGKSEWSFKNMDSEILISFSARSTYKTDKIASGFGMRNITAQIGNLGGSFHSYQDKSIYRIAIRIPF